MRRTPVSGPGRGHVFISYVSDDSERVDRLTALLQSSGIEVWRDREKLRPGQDWRFEIKQAIERSSLAFLPCFSARSEERERTYQRREIRLAIEQFHLLQPFTTWFIPVRFDDCVVPDYELGPGQFLSDLHRVDLFDGDWSQGKSLVEALLGVMGPPSPPASRPATTTRPAPEDVVADPFATALLDPTKTIEFDRLVNRAVRVAREQLADPERYPPSSSVLDDVLAGMQFIQQQIASYSDDLRAVFAILMLGCAYGRPDQRTMWKRIVERLSRVASPSPIGHTVLLNLRRLASVGAVYAGALGAAYNENFEALAAITIGAVNTDRHRRDAMISVINPLLPFEGQGEVANLATLNAVRRCAGEDLVHETDIVYAAPQSDYFAANLWPVYAELFAADHEEYVAIFDAMEVLLAVIAQDDVELATRHGALSSPGWVARAAHRVRGGGSALEDMMKAVKREREQWPPLRAGLFGGRPERVIVAAEQLERLAATSPVRPRRPT